MLFSGILLGVSILFTRHYTAREAGRDNPAWRFLNEIHRRMGRVGRAGLLDAADAAHAAADLAAADLRRHVDRFLLLSRVVFLFGTLGTVTGCI